MNDSALSSPAADIGSGRSDRLVRKIYRAFRSRTQRHNQHLWPFVRIARDRVGAITGFKAFGKSVKLTPLSEGFDPAHKEVHLILSGPSVAEIRYDELDIKVAMGVNGSIVLARQFDLPFRYYCIIDQTFVRQRIDLVREVVARDLTLYVTPDVLRYLMQGIPPETYRCRICVIELVSERAYERRASPEVLSDLVASSPELKLFNAREGLGYSFNASLGVFDADTVAYPALQVLVSGGAQTVYLHGLDITASKGLRFYDEGDNPQFSRLGRNFERLIEPSFRFAAALLRKRNVNIFNLSPISSLSGEVIPRFDWHDLPRK